MFHVLLLLFFLPLFALAQSGDHSLFSYNLSSVPSVFEIKTPSENQDSSTQIGPLSSYFVLTPSTRAVVLARKINEHGAAEGSRQWLEEDAKYVAGYVGLAYTMHRFSNAFLFVDLDEFDRTTGAKMKKNPAKVLYVNMIDEKDRLGGFPEIEFQRLYRDHKNATMIKAGSLNELREKLRNLPKDGSFDRIEFFAHGRPGMMTVGQDKLDAEGLRLLKNLDLKFAAKGADLRLVSCSVAGGNISNRQLGENFVESLGKAILPDGGQVFAATRNILAEKIPAERMLQHTMGISLISDVIFRMTPAVLRDLRQARLSHVEVRIPGSSSDLAQHPGDCVRGFSSLVIRSVD